MKKVAVYIRVSTLEQANEGYSIPAQKERLTAFCKAHDWLIHNFYVDGGFTGANLERPGIQKLISETSSFDMVLVYKLDRLSRSQRDTLYLIEEVFLPAGVDFVSVNESFDTSTPFGRAMIGILSVFAQLEREQIRERTIMGRLARAKEGLRKGGGPDPIGYKKVGDTLEILDYEAAQVRLIYNWFLSGMKKAAIVEKLAEEGFSTRYRKWNEHPYGDVTVGRMLKNPIYIGTLTFGDVVVEDAHPPIIEKEDFYRAQDLLAKITEVYGSAPRGKYLLSGLIYCGDCGGRYRIRGYDKHRYYVCYSRNKSAKRMIKTADCSNKNWVRTKLEEVVSGEITKLLFTDKYYETLRKNKAKKPIKKNRNETELQKKIASLDVQIGKFMDLFGEDVIPAETLSQRIEKLHHEKTLLKEELDKLSNHSPFSQNSAPIENLLSELSLLWDCATEAERRFVVQSLVKKIVIRGDSVEIEWLFLDD